MSGVKNVFHGKAIPAVKKDSVRSRQPCENTARAVNTRIIFTWLGKIHMPPKRAAPETEESQQSDSFQSNGSTRQKVGPVKKGRGPNWGEKEVSALVKAGVQVNLDEINGSDNKSGSGICIA